MSSYRSRPSGLLGLTHGDSPDLLLPVPGDTLTAQTGSVGLYLPPEAVRELLRLLIMPRYVQLKLSIDVQLKLSTT